MYITYVMDTGFNSFSTLSNEVSISSNSITLVSSDNYSVGDIILVDNEFMLIQEISAQAYSRKRLPKLIKANSWYWNLSSKTCHRY